MKEKILVVAAHPDDEILGCGATLAKLAALGNEVRILILGEGVDARGEKDGNNTAQKHRLRDQAVAASQALGLSEPPTILNFPDNRFDAADLLEIVQSIETVISRFSPTRVYTHSASDLNVDHTLTHRAVLTACRPTNASSVRGVYAFQTVSATEWAFGQVGGPFHPQRFEDVTSSYERKEAALGCYALELRPFPHPRSIENLRAQAVTVGANVGFTLAEAFEIIWEKRP